MNQVAYTLEASTQMQPSRELLKPGKWFWDSNMDTLFQTCKDVILKLIHQGVKCFKPNWKTCLATDWLKGGVGFVLLQKYCQCSMDTASHRCPDGWHLVFEASHFTTPTESRYVLIEGEALAVVYGSEKCWMFVLGCPNRISVLLITSSCQYPRSV